MKISTANGVHCQVTIMITARAEVWVARKDTGSISGHKEKKWPSSGTFCRAETVSFIPATANPFRPNTGSRIILIHSTAFTAGIIKNGEINKTLTIPRPGNDRLIRTAIASPNPTVSRITLDTMNKLFCTANQKSLA